MKNILFAVLAIFSLSANASHLEKVCQEAVRSTPIFEQDLISRRNFRAGDWFIESTDGKLLATLNVPVRELIKTEDTIWVLAPFDLIEMNHDGEIRETYNFEPTMNQNWGALSMVKVGDMMVISRGPAGMLGYDLINKKVAWMNVLGEGQPSGLVTDGKVVYAAAATSREFGFTGIISFNPQNGTIIKSAAYQKSAGVMDTDVKAEMYNGNIVLNNGGWIHMITIAQVNSGKDIKPRWVAHRVPRDGDVNEHYMMTNGGFFFEGNEIISCGNYTTKENDQFVRKSKMFKFKMP